MDTQIDMLEKCAQKIVKSRRIVCFTGAGMSAESGIETFRGGSGLWSGALGSVVLGWFGTPIGWNWTPGFAWSKFIDRFYNPIRDAQPNDGHRALYYLQRMFPNLSIITQNVDGLHQRAGSNPNTVIEIHGTVRRSRCIKKGHHYDFHGNENLPRKSPTCRFVGCNSKLRPDCVLFTEALPNIYWTQALTAVRVMERDDVMIIVGTSAQVYPAASLLDLANDRGVTLIDVNLVRTNSSYENYEYLGGTAATTLPALVGRVGQLKKASRAASNKKKSEDLQHST